MNFRKATAAAAIAAGAVVAIAAPATAATPQRGYETHSIYGNFEDCGRTGHYLFRSVGGYDSFRCLRVNNPNGSSHYALQFLRK